AWRNRRVLGAWGPPGFESPTPNPSPQERGGESGAGSAPLSASRGEGRGWGGPSITRLRLEVEVLDVLLGEDERRAEQDFAAVDDAELAELAGLDRRVPGLQFAVGDRADDVGRGIR